MCHVVSSNSYKNLPADRWIHTTGEKGLEFVVSERREDRSTDFSISDSHTNSENVPRILDELVIWGKVLIVKCGFMKWSGLVGATVLPSVDHWSNKQARGLAFPKSIFETFIQCELKEWRWAHSQKMILEGEKLKVWKVLEINWTQTSRLGKDKQKEQGGRGSLHHQPPNIS